MIFGIAVSDILFSVGLFISLWGLIQLTNKDKWGWIVSAISLVLYGIGEILVGYTVFASVSFLFLISLLISFFRWDTDDEQKQEKFDTINFGLLVFLFVLSSVLNLLWRNDFERVFFEILITMFVFISHYLRQKKNAMNWIYLALVHVLAGILFVIDGEWVLLVGKIIFFGVCIRGWRTWRKSII